MEIMSTPTVTRSDYSSDSAVLKPDSGSDSTDFTVSVPAPRPSSAYSQPRLPIEVCEHIIYFISMPPFDKYWEPHRNLAACCLICRAWFPRSRLHLYQNVRLDDSKYYGNNLSHFVQCLKHIPNNFNGRLVQRLEVSFWKSRAASLVIPGSGVSFTTNQLPLLLPNLVSITIDSADLINVHPTFYTSLSRFTSVRRLTLSSTTYSTYDQSFRFIAGFRNLTNLEIHSLMNVEPVFRGRRGDRQLTIPHLRLTMSSSGGFFPDMMSWFSPCTESLDVSVLPGSGSENTLETEVQAVLDFIQRCGDSLQRLRFAYQAKRPTYSIGSPLYFSHNTTLRSLALIGIPIDGHRDHRGGVAGGAQSLAYALTTVSSTRLDDLTVLLYHWDTEDRLMRINSSAWEHIDSAFALPVFDRLRHIHVGIQTGRGKFISNEKMARLLPQLVSRPAFTSVSSYPEASGNNLTPPSSEHSMSLLYS